MTQVKKRMLPWLAIDAYRFNQPVLHVGVSFALFLDGFTDFSDKHVVNIVLVFSAVNNIAKVGALHLTSKILLLYISMTYMFGRARFL